jgi:hypothetical protein
MEYWSIGVLECWSEAWARNGRSSHFATRDANPLSDRVPGARLFILNPFLIVLELVNRFRPFKLYAQVLLAVVLALDLLVGSGGQGLAGVARQISSLIGRSGKGIKQAGRFTYCVSAEASGNVRRRHRAAVPK